MVSRVPLCDQLYRCQETEVARTETGFVALKCRRADESVGGLPTRTNGKIQYSLQDHHTWPRILTHSYSESALGA
ncbi:hypothetical protein AOLI_G00192500 [Acnodon oligacanthus]